MAVFDKIKHTITTFPCLFSG